MNVNLFDPAINTTSLSRNVVNGYSWCTVPKLEVNVGER